MVAMNFRILFPRDIKREGMCKEEPDRECTSSCQKFMRGECPGMRYIKWDTTHWTDQERNPSALYSKLKEDKK